VTPTIPLPSTRVPPFALGHGRTGVVVCGGASRRMGRDKAELELLCGTTFLAHAIATLRPVVDEVLLATGPTPRYVEFGLPVVLDVERDLGPLAGLEAALRAARHERVVVLAVDMPAIDSHVLATLAERAEQNDLDALVLASASGPEPLCGVYHTRLAVCIRSALAAGERRMTALFSYPLADGRRSQLATIDVAECADRDATLNVNTAEDLARARAALHAEVRA